MNFKSRSIRGVLLAVTVAFAVASVPAAGASAASAKPDQQKAILKAPSKAILKAPSKAIL